MDHQDSAQATKNQFLLYLCVRTLDEARQAGSMNPGGRITPDNLLYTDELHKKIINKLNKKRVF